ncbi:MAG: hypothetical protein IT455_13350 [Planctomycetes bacterium]|nr:hypothetical protein [Planctomycetota bacterium]
MQRALSMLLAAAAVVPARAQERSLRLVERTPPAATVAPPTTPWPTDFAAALAARRPEASWADVLKRVDFVAASLEAGLSPPLEVARDLAIPSARCVPHDLLSMDE